MERLLDAPNVSVQIEHDLEEVLGAAAVATYQAWVQERELWVTKERQAQERLQLAREELGRLRRGLAGQEGWETMSAGAIDQT